MGADAEYLCMPEDGLIAKKPDSISHDEAASIPYGALTALNLLRKVNIQNGQKVLIIGASGAIGSAAVQLAKYYGADVTGVCSTQRSEFVKAIGADRVIDYTKEDFTKDCETYDLIFDILGKGSFSRLKKCLNQNGHYLLASFKMKQLLQMLWTSITSNLFRSGKGRKVICALSSENREDLIIIKELIEKEKIKSIIDKRYPMESAAEAHRYVEAGSKKGNVIINMVH
jgi:NADPH:quinone reductase-like Zn-dependent oxidoreductase